MHTMQTANPSTVTIGSRPLTPATAALAVAVVLSGLSAGFFFTYQVSVVRGLAIVDDVSYVESFQAINATIRNAPFGVVFFGTVPAIAIAGLLVRNTTPRVRALAAVGFVLALATVVITFAGSVPLNNQLADAATTPSGAATARDAFEATWNRLNLARTFTSVGAAAALAMAAVSHRQG